MELVWDADKAEANVEKHGLDFEDAARVFAFPMRVRLDDREDYGEDRSLGYGMLEGRVVAVVFTEPRPDSVRIISMRKALPLERKLYEQYLKDELGAG